jgi:Chromo (CHRromatin Organisation MOdifier) domain
MTRDGPQTLHLDRVIRAPSIRDLPSGVEVLPPRKKIAQSKRAQTMETDDEFVIERLISHGEAEDGKMLIRVRWAGYSNNDDTWEPAENIPHQLIRRYAKKKNVAPALFGLQ